MSTREWLRGAGLAACALVIAAMLLVAVGFPASARYRQATQDPVVTPTPVVGSTSGQLQAPPEASTPEASQATQPTPAPGTSETTGPVSAGVEGDTAPPVLAQGLIYLTGNDVVWQVREVELTGEETVTGNARVILQRSGSSIVRNDLTGKRAKLEPGEAYFASADDPYTTYIDGGGSAVLWVFEIANNNDVGEGAFYLSPNVPGYGEAVYDFEFARNVLASGEAATFEGGVGPSLLVVLSGTVDVASDDGTASLSVQDGLVVATGATVTATSDEAVYVTLIVGPEVSGGSAAPPAPDTDTAAPEPATADDAPADDTGTDAAEPSDPPAQPAEPSGDAGAYVTSIQVGALDSIGVTMYVDGEVVFDGWLEPGEYTDFYTGTVFEVYTTSGANTQFQNTCGGEPFWMDFTEGDAYYVLEATADSCAPV